MLKTKADRGIDEPVVQIAVRVVVMIKDIVELSVGVDIKALEVVSQRHTASKPKLTPLLNVLSPM